MHWLASILFFYCVTATTFDFYEAGRKVENVIRRVEQFKRSLGDTYGQTLTSGHRGRSSSRQFPFSPQNYPYGQPNMYDFYTPWDAIENLAQLSRWPLFGQMPPTPPLRWPVFNQPGRLCTTFPFCPIDNSRRPLSRPIYTNELPSPPRRQAADRLSTKWPSRRVYPTFRPFKRPSLVFDSHSTKGSPPHSKGSLPPTKGSLPPTRRVLGPVTQEPPEREDDEKFQVEVSTTTKRPVTLAVDLGDDDYENTATTEISTFNETLLDGSLVASDNAEPDEEDIVRTLEIGWDDEGPNSTEATTVASTFPAITDGEPFTEMAIELTRTSQTDQDNLTGTQTSFEFENVTSKAIVLNQTTANPESVTTPKVEGDEKGEGTQSVSPPLNETTNDALNTTEVVTLEDDGALANSSRTPSPDLVASTPISELLIPNLPAFPELVNEEALDRARSPSSTELPAISTAVSTISLNASELEREDDPKEEVTLSSVVQREEPISTATALIFTEQGTFPIVNATNLPAVEQTESMTTANGETTATEVLDLEGDARSVSDETINGTPSKSRGSLLNLTEPTPGPIADEFSTTAVSLETPTTVPASELSSNASSTVLNSTPATNSSDGGQVSAIDDSTMTIEIDLNQSTTPSESLLANETTTLPSSSTQPNVTTDVVNSTTESTTLDDSSTTSFRQPRRGDVDEEF